jgi:DUF4097 and DUF4098 domain-containing protein YvlB
MKPLLRVALALGGAFLVSALTVTACVVVSDHGLEFGFNSSDWPEKAERTDTRELNLKSGQTLRTDTPDGSIHVHASNGSSASMRAVVRAAGRTQADAQALLDRTTIVVEETARGVSLRLDVGRDPADEHRPQPSVAFEIEVPADVALELASRSGNVQAEGGPFGPAHLESSYGGIEVENVRGDVHAASNSGKVEVAHVSKGSVDASSGYGNVSVTDVDGGSVEAKSSSGRILIERLRVQRVTAESGYGSVSVKDVDAERDLEARSSSGSVTAESVKGARIQLASGYGAIRLKQAQGELALETKSGHISVDDVRGALVAKTGYGSVDVDGVFTGLTLESSSGSVKARARDGSKVDSEWSLASSYGRVELQAPKGLACDLSAKTGYGQIEIGYELAVAPGALAKNGKDVQGRINGGGKTVRLQSGSGSVVISPANN